MSRNDSAPLSTAYSTRPSRSGPFCENGLRCNRYGPESRMITSDLPGSVSGARCHGTWASLSRWFIADLSYRNGTVATAITHTSPIRQPAATPPEGDERGRDEEAQRHEERDEVHRTGEKGEPAREPAAPEEEVAGREHQHHAEQQPGGAITPAQPQPGGGGQQPHVAPHQELRDVERVDRGPAHRLTNGEVHADDAGHELAVAEPEGVERFLGRERELGERAGDDVVLHQGQDQERQEARRTRARRRGAGGPTPARW